MKRLLTKLFLVIAIACTPATIISEDDDFLPEPTSQSTLLVSNDDDEPIRLYLVDNAQHLLGTLYPGESHCYRLTKTSTMPHLVATSLSGSAMSQPFDPSTSFSLVLTHLLATSIDNLLSTKSCSIALN